MKAVHAAVSKLIFPPADIEIGAVALRGPPFVVVAHVAHAALPVAAVIANGADAVTAGVPLPVPHTTAAAPAAACTV